MSIDEVTYSNMQEVVAVVKVLEQFGGMSEMGKQIAPKTTHRVRTSALNRKTRSA